MTRHDAVSTNAPNLDLSNISIRDRPAPRLLQLVVGLSLFGTSMALMVRSGLGLNPWDVLHQGLAPRLGWSFGAVTALTGVLVLLAWFPLRQRPGVGTIANVAIIAISVDLALAMIPAGSTPALRLALLIGGILLNGVATALYVGARLGPGPRDGLTTGLNARTGWSIRGIRTGVELAVLTTGWFLGGTVGVGTVLFALLIGPITQLFLPLVTVGDHRGG
ncbi:membrane protein YczE [Parasphingorhabdus pacifica]